MIEKIGHVIFNESYYQHNDQYSDGDVENDLLEYVKSGADLDAIALTDGRWPVLYHLSSRRHCLIDWLSIAPEARLLEIGSGCGAITSALVKKGAQVTAVELSKRRSMINAYRNQKCSNLEIFVGNFGDIRFQQTYDYIFLIGVLEYARTYTGRHNGDYDFLQTIKSLLAPGGTLVIAIENRLGLKYWAGAREDHLGTLFNSLEGYQPESPALTYSKCELTSLLKRVGYQNLYYYYPYPDYKFPMTIYSQDFLPKKGELLDSQTHYDMDRLILFDESKVYDSLINEGIFDRFANSFLVLARLS